MSLQLILGSAGSGKSHYIYEKIIRESMEHPDQDYLILVPDQFTMQTQIEMAGRHPRGGLLNIDVSSFSRLAYRIFLETGYKLPPLIDDMGKTMVLKRVAQKKKNELRLLKKQVGKTGYMKEIKSLVSEFMQYDISPEKLQEISEKTDSPLLEAKLADTGILYRGFLDFIAEHYATSEEMLDLLSRVIPKSDSIKHTTIVLDGFTGFTPIQYRLITALLKACPKLYVTVTLDEKGKKQRAGDIYQLFHLSRKTIESLTRRAAEEKIYIEDPVFLELDKEKSRFAGKDELAFLQAHLFRYSKKSYPGKPARIHAFEADSPGAEMEEVLRRICFMVREKGYRFRDFAIITGDLDSYGFEACRVLSAEGIPCFLDRRRSVSVNPLVEFVRASWDLLLSSFSGESMVRYLRCGFTPLLTEEIDEMENYLLALGIKGRKNWEKSFLKASAHMDPARVPALEILRKEIMEVLTPFAEAIQEKNRTVRSCCMAMYQLFVSLQVEKKLGEKRAAFEEEGNLALAREYAQIYKKVIDLLDKMVEILGDEPITIKDFGQMLEEGISELRVGIIPPSKDQVLIGDVERTRLKNVKALFFVGVDDQVIPGNPSAGGLLSEADRESLTGLEVELAPSPRETLFIQKFYLYLHLTKPSDYLCISYAVSSAKGEPRGPAYLFGSLKRLFPALSIEHVYGPSRVSDMENLSDARTILTDSLKNLHHGLPGADALELIGWFYRQERGTEKVEKLVQAVISEPASDVIAESVAKALYGDILMNSVSRLEKYAACAYAHFLQYGLNLKEREEYSFSLLDMGNILHAGVERYGKKAKKEGYSFCTLPADRVEPLISLCIDELIEEYGNQILKSSARNRRMAERAKKLLGRSIWTIREELGDGDFEPEGFEVSFDSGSFLDSMCLELSEKSRMYLKGKIDRIDLCREENRLMVRIVDYKSGSKKFSLEDFYYGLQMQLILYMKAAMEMQKKKHPDMEIEPAAFLYYQMKDPLISREDGKDPDESRLKELKMNGLLSAREEIYTHLDRVLKDKGKTSRLLPIGRKTDGSLTKASQVAEPEQFEAMSRFAMEKAADMGKEILKGHAEKNPYRREDDKTACDYCPMREGCDFDIRMPGRSYRYLEKKSKEELWERIMKRKTSEEEDG